MTTIKKGSKGADVKTLQMLLNKIMGANLVIDGIFGSGTEQVLKNFQQRYGLVTDGICGSKTWSVLEKLNKELSANPHNLYTDYFLKSGEYVAGIYPKDLIVLHHTAGGPSPYLTIDIWNRDAQGRVSTEYVVGGQSSKNGDATYDGEILHAYPTGAYGFHIGKAGVSGIDKRSVGIELCNMGHVDKNGLLYTGAKCIESQICHLSEPFRGYTDFHKYSDKQIESLRKLMLFIAERDNIDLHTGLYQWIKKQGAKAFDFQPDAYYGRVKNGVVTHANIRKDKEDVSPQPDLIDMILSL